jgi:hypothetical protein
LATRDLATAGPDDDADVLAQRIDHVAGRIIDGGRLWEEREAR